MRLFPRDPSFTELFSALGDDSRDAVGLLARMLGAGPGDERDALAAQLSAVERRADETTHAIARRNHSSLVTPFDRSDVHLLASALDDCVDHLEAAGLALVAYRPRTLPPAVAEMVGQLQGQAESTAAAVRRLPAVRDLAEHWVGVNQLQNEADRTHRRALAALFDAERDPVEVLRAKEVLDALHRAATAFESVASAVQSLAAKEA